MTVADPSTSERIPEKPLEPITKEIVCTPNKNIARIAKRCPEKITSVVKCVKLLFSKILRE